MHASTMISSSSGSSKRTCKFNGSKRDSCSVDDCDSDLSKCRDYYRRHRVCEQHSKAPFVIVGGLEERFCQQCSKFHCLVEFDEVKRSCRRQLHRHNQRRRRPHPGSLCSRSRRFVSNLQDTKFLQFSVRSQKWSMPMTAKSEPEAMTYKCSLQLLGNDQHSNPNTYPWTYNEENKWFSFLQSTDQKISNRAGPELCFCQPIHDNAVPSEVGIFSHESDGSGTSQSMNTSGALYLLSTDPTYASGTGFRPVLPPGLQVNGVAQLLHSHGVTNEITDPVLGPDAKRNQH